MAKRLDMLVTIKDEVDNATVYNEVKEYGFNTISVGNELWVHGKVLSGDPAIGEIVQICAKYGEYTVHLKLV